jgi:hypothetical protein
MKLSHVTAAGLAVLALVAGAGPAPDLESIVDRHVAARGGRAAIEAVRAYETEIRIVEPAFEVDGTYVATRDGQMRVDIVAGGQPAFTEALDGSRAWTWTPDSGVGGGRRGPAARHRAAVQALRAARGPRARPSTRARRPGDLGRRRLSRAATGAR